jgi:LysM repeat protein
MPRMFWHKSSRATWSASTSVSALALLATLSTPAWLAAQGAPAKTHTVRRGDTLWDLAKQYRGDPFLWPDIYRLNTAVVEDPHWVYPGEVLRLSGADNVRAVPATDTPPTEPAPRASSDTASVPTDVASGDSAGRRVGGLPEMSAADTGYTSLFSVETGKVMRETLRAYTEQTYRPLRRSEFYSSGFLTEGQALPFGTLLGPVTPSQIKSFSNRDVPTLYTTVGIAPPAGGSYQVGDSLLLAQVGGEIEGYGEMVVPVGLARVTEAVDGRYLATVIAVYGSIRKGQQVLPPGRFMPADSVRAKPVADGVRGRLLGGKGRQELKAPQMVVFIDKGRQDGVAPGDLFEARRRPRRLADGALRVDEVMAEFQIVRVGERTATARVINVLSPDLPPGTEVRQVAKLP